MTQSFMHVEIIYASQWECRNLHIDLKINYSVNKINEVIDFISNEIKEQHIT